MTDLTIETYDTTITVEDVSYSIEVESPYYLEVIEQGTVTSTIIIGPEYNVIDSSDLQRLDIISETIEFIEDVLPGPPGPVGPSGPPGTELAQTVAGPIAVGATQVIDAVSVLAYSAVHWILVVKDLVANRYMHLQVSAVKSPSQPEPKHARSAVLADKLNVTETVTFDGLNIVLSITNNHTNPVYVSFVRTRVQ